jgi:phosphate transport system substrate-binding protein
VAIGYVEYAYVKHNNLAFTLMQNSAGKFVASSANSFVAAAASADWTYAEDFNLVMTNVLGPNACPITSTFVLLYKQPKNAAASASARKFFNWALANGHSQAAGLDYVPLPVPWVQPIRRYMPANVR